MENDKKINNIGIIGHVDHGSTTLSAATISALTSTINNKSKVVVVGASKDELNVLQIADVGDLEH